MFFCLCYCVVQLCVDVSGMCLVWGSVEERVVFTPHQQRAPESHALPHRGRNWEILAGSVRDPGDLESARKEVDTSPDQHSTVKFCNSCYFSSTHSPEPRCPGTPSNPGRRSILLQVGSQAGLLTRKGPLLNALLAPGIPSLPSTYVSQPQGSQTPSCLEILLWLPSLALQSRGWNWLLSPGWVDVLDEGRSQLCLSPS